MSRNLAIVLRCLPIFALIGPALAADNYIVLDGNRNPVTFRAKDTGTGQLQQTSPSDPTGAPFSQANPQFFNLELNGIALQPGSQSKSAGLPIAPPTDPDLRPSSGIISVVDSVSTTTSGIAGSSIVTGSPSVNSSASQTVNGLATARVQIAGSWVATLQLEQSIDGGTTWGAMGCHVNGAPAIASPVNAVTANGMLECEAAGATNIRARASAFSSGSAVVTMTFTRYAGSVKVTNTAVTSAAGATSTDASGTIATGGSYQTLAAASATRKGCMIQNPTTASEVLNVKFATMAQPFTLAAGTFLNCKMGDVVLQDAITVMGATNAHAFAAIVQ